MVLINNINKRGKVNMNKKIIMLISAIGLSACMTIAAQITTTETVLRTKF